LLVSKRFSAHRRQPQQPVSRLPVVSHRPQVQRCPPQFLAHLLRCPAGMPRPHQGRQGRRLRGRRRRAMQSAAQHRQMTPTRFVRGQMVRDFDLFPDLLINRLEPLAAAQHDLGRGAAAQANAEEPMESVGNLAVGHAGTLVEIDDGGLGVGTKLALGGTGRVAGLQGMATAPPMRWVQGRAAACLPHRAARARSAR